METSIVKISPELLAMFAEQGGGGLVPFTREIFLLDISVAGTGYCEQIEDVYPKLEINTILQLRRDPDNPHDEFAIGILYEGIRIGWIPRKLNTVISRLMDAGKAFFCRVSSLHEEDDHWKNIECKVYMVE